MRVVIRVIRKNITLGSNITSGITLGSNITSDITSGITLGKLFSCQTTMGRPITKGMTFNSSAGNMEYFEPNIGIEFKFYKSTPK